MKFIYFYQSKKKPKKFKEKTIIFNKVALIQKEKNETDKNICQMQKIRKSRQPNVYKQRQMTVYNTYGW